ncbi:MAG: 50S ribosomal protein L18Ae [Thermoproteus sp.]
MAKIYLVEGRAKLQSGVMKFKLYIPATKPRDAMEKAYELIGSRHKAKRYQIYLGRVEEIAPDKAPDNAKIFSYIDRVVVY